VLSALTRRRYLIVQPIIFAVSLKHESGDDFPSGLAEFFLFLNMQAKMNFITTSLV
jgi:hypothetical protein